MSEKYAREACLYGKLAHKPLAAAPQPSRVAIILELTHSDIMGNAVFVKPVCPNLGRDANAVLPEARKSGAFDLSQRVPGAGRGGNEQVD